MKRLLQKLDYRIPSHALSPGYALGGLSAFVFLVMVVTGFCLAFLYVPTRAGAYESMLAIVNGPWTNLIRALHVRAAEWFIALVILHVTRIVLTKSFLGLRKWTWYVGLVLFALIMANYFSGTVLKWDQEGYEAYAHLVAVGDLIPGGDWLGSFLETSTLIKMYVLHISLVPLLIVVGIGVHVLLVKVLEISPPVPDHSVERTAWFSRHLRRLVGWGMVVLGMLMLAAVYSPPGLMVSAWSGVEWTKPPWPFFVLYGLESWFGLDALIWGPLVLAAVGLGLPFLARRDSGADCSTWVYLAVLGMFFLITLYVALAPPVQHL